MFKITKSDPKKIGSEIFLPIVKIYQNKKAAQKLLAEMCTKLTYVISKF